MRVRVKMRLRNNKDQGNLVPHLTALKVKTTKVAMKNQLMKNTVKRRRKRRRRRRKKRVTRLNS